MFPESKEPIRSGCGPPPYYSDTKKEASVWWLCVLIYSIKTKITEYRSSEGGWVCCY
jgi:hypothetical protein